MNRATQHVYGWNEQKPRFHTYNGWLLFICLTVAWICVAYTFRINFSFASNRTKTVFIDGLLGLSGCAVARFMFAQKVGHRDKQNMTIKAGSKTNSPLALRLHGDCARTRVKGQKTPTSLAHVHYTEQVQKSTTAKVQEQLQGYVQSESIKYPFKSSRFSTHQMSRIFFSPFKT